MCVQMPTEEGESEPRFCDQIQRRCGGWVIAAKHEDLVFFVEGSCSKASESWELSKRKTMDAEKRVAMRWPPVLPIRERFSGWEHLANRIDSEKLSLSAGDATRDEFRKNLLQCKKDFLHVLVDGQSVVKMDERQTIGVEKMRANMLDKHPNSFVKRHCTKMK